MKLVIHFVDPFSEYCFLFLHINSKEIEKHRNVLILEMQLMFAVFR